MGTATLADSRTGPAGSQPRGSPGWLARGLRLLSVPIALLPLLGAQDAAPKPVEPNGDSGAPSISDDGRFVVFESRASNLVPWEHPESWDVFFTWGVYLWERDSGVITRLSDETELTARSPLISGDGRWITFLQPERAALHPRTDAGERIGPVLWKVGLYDRHERALRWLGHSTPTYDYGQRPYAASISRDGSRVAFAGRVGELDTIQLYEARKQTTAIANLTLDGKPSVTDATDPVLSRDGRFLVFTTAAKDLATFPAIQKGMDRWISPMHPPLHVIRRDLETGEYAFASHLGLEAMGDGQFKRARVSDSGQIVAYEHKDSEWSDAIHVGFVSDLKQQAHGRLLSVPGGEGQWQGRMSISWLSADGLHLLVEAAGTVEGPQPWRQAPSQVYLRDLIEPSWTLISQGQEGQVANAASGGGVASRDMSTIAFWSSATNLVAGDTNNARDIFIVDRKAGKISRIEARP